VLGRLIEGFFVVNAKAKLPILSTPSGITIFLRLLHIKAKSPMILNDAGNVIEVGPES
jgi:hypothetical protein